MLSFSEKHESEHAKGQSKFSVTPDKHQLVHLYWLSCKYASSHWQKTCCNFEEPLCSQDNV